MRYVKPEATSRLVWMSVMGADEVIVEAVITDTVRALVDGETLLTMTRTFAASGLFDDETTSEQVLAMVATPPAVPGMDLYDVTDFLPSIETVED